MLIQCRRASDQPARAFETVVARRASLEDVDFTRLGDVRLVRKRSPHAPFPNRIGVGRTPSVDVSVNHRAISKYHAFFELHEKGVWTLSDAGSKNGTTVNDERLIARIARPIEDGARVRFGHLEFLFCSAEGFLQLVANRVRT